MGMRDKKCETYTELGKKKGIGCNLYTGTQPRSAQGMEEHMQTSGYCVIHGIHKLISGIRASRGATARLLRMSTFELTENDSETQESLEGRITCKKVI